MQHPNWRIGSVAEMRCSFGVALGPATGTVTESDSLGRVKLVTTHGTSVVCDVDEKDPRIAWYRLEFHEDGTMTDWHLSNRPKSFWL